MTQSSNRLLDEFAKLATDAAAVAQSMRREAETVMRAQAERLLSEMNVVPREDFEAVKDLATRTADELDEARRTIAALEARLDGLEAGKPASKKVTRLARSESAGGADAAEDNPAPEA